MVYEFPMNMAVQCIPIYNGEPEEFEPFLNIVRYFASKIPEGEDYAPLLSVVYTKLKGKAAFQYPVIKADTWPKVEQKLIAKFGYKKPTGELIQDIETLFQGPNESFMEYKERAEVLFHEVKALPTEGIGSYVDTVLRLHFLAGLKKRSLALSGSSQREKIFPDLLERLHIEYEDERILKNIHNRLHSLQRVSKQSICPNYNQRDNREHRNFNYNNPESFNNNDSILLRDKRHNYCEDSYFWRNNNSLTNKIEHRERLNESWRNENHNQAYYNKEENYERKNKRHRSRENLEDEFYMDFNMDNSERYEDDPQSKVKRRYQDERYQSRDCFEVNSGEIELEQNLDMDETRASSRQSFYQNQNYDHVKPRNSYLVKNVFNMTEYDTYNL